MLHRFRRHVPCWVALVALAASAPSRAATSILFDATKAEMAGSADWVIDADVRNLGASGSTEVAGAGSDSNPAYAPTPAQSTVTAATKENYWSGALSSWGIDAVQRGFQVNTLPYNDAITYGTAAAHDLKNYKVFVVDEPNIAFTAAEQTALVNFVSNGGGLMIIADHAGSDRNNDGKDSPTIWNDLATAKGNPFGITFNTTGATGSDTTLTSSAVDTTATDPISRGPAGSVVNFAYNDGSLMTIDPTKNSSVKSAIWSSSTHTNANVMAAYATYGSGRVVAVGDSSPADDGTGDPGDALYAGWTTASDALVFENAELWLSGSTTANAPTPEPATLATLAIAGALLRRRRVKLA